MAEGLEIVITPILTNGIKTLDGRQLYKDYGFSYVSINGVGGVMLSGDYLLAPPDAPNDNPGENVYYSEPVCRDTDSWKPEEGFGFIG